MFGQIKDTFSEFLWQENYKDANALQTFFIQALRIFYGTARDISDGLPSLRAMSLVYTTLLSIVPLLAVSFSVLKGFGAHNQLEPALASLLEPLGEKGTQISQQIIGFVDNMQVGVLGALGLLLLIYTVLSLVKKIENAFNATWRIRNTRNIFQRFSNYLSVILVGPLLLFTAAGINASFNNSAFINKVAAIEPFGTMLLLMGETLPYILTIVTFTLIYVLIPNTKVKFSSALYGGVAATILWNIIGVLFKSFIVNSTNYTAIYSSFAIIIIFMIWIYANWMIVLTGASISYYHQYPDRISKKSQILRLSCQLREKLALTIMQIIAASFHNNESSWTLKNLTKKISISEPALILVLSALQEKKLITTTGDEDQHYMLNLASESISIDMILNAARSAEETKSLHPDDIAATEKVNEVILSLENAITESNKNVTLKDLL
jgi:membrane protein